MKTKHILAVLSTCLVAVSFSPINFFSQAAPPPGFTIFDGKEFQFDCTSLDEDLWHTAFTCPVGRTMKITSAFSTVSPYVNSEFALRVTRASSSQTIGTYFQYNIPNSGRELMLSAGDVLEYNLGDVPNAIAADSACINGIVD